MHRLTKLFCARKPQKNKINGGTWKLLLTVCINDWFLSCNAYMASVLTYIFGVAAVFSRVSKFAMACESKPDVVHAAPPEGPTQTRLLRCWSSRIHAHPVDMLFGGVLLLSPVPACHSVRCPGTLRARTFPTASPVNVILNLLSARRHLNRPVRDSDSSGFYPSRSRLPQACPYPKAHNRRRPIHKRRPFFS